jgi:hypothetical protein
MEWELISLKVCEFIAFLIIYNYTMLFINIEGPYELQFLQ